MEDTGSLTDEEIVGRIKAELKDASIKDPLIDANDAVNALFEILYDRYEVPLHNYIGKMLFDKEMVDDIFHEVIIRVYTNIHRFVVKTSFKAWVYRIATNVSINYIKSFRYREKLLLNMNAKTEGRKKEIIETIQGKNEHHEESIAISEAMKAVEDIVISMPREIREVFLLRQNRQLTFDDIAAIVGCSSRHVKTRMARALAILEDELGKRNITKDILSGGI